MKNLKKLLALVLVAVMVLSFGAISASAAFTDTASSNYQEAIGVLSGIGVINGTTATTFEPTGSLTRAAAAKVITYMLLGPTNAALISSAASQTFSDVPTSHWASGYIDYCASTGIIAGTGDGTFNPEGTLTTLAFTKMLLVALGYNADIEGYVGPNWAINIASDALSAGVYDSTIPMSANAICTREQAAQLAFKALLAITVQYQGGSTITIGNSTITTGATRSDVPNNTATDTIVDDDLMQFAEKYFTKLSKSPAFIGGRNGYFWMNGTAYITGFISSDVVLATKTSGTAYSDLTNPTNSRYIGFLPDSTVTYYYNDSPAAAAVSGTGGWPGAAADLATNIAAIQAAVDKAGVIVNFIDTDQDNKYDVVAVIEKTVERIAAAPTVRTAGSLSFVTIGSLSDLDSRFVIYPEGLVKDDVILWYQAGPFTYVEKATAVTGTITAHNVFGMTINGTTYGVSELTGRVMGTTHDYAALAGMLGKAGYTFYVDNGNNICYAVAPSGAALLTNTYLVTATDVTTSFGIPTYKAIVVAPDGTAGVITVKKTASFGGTLTNVNGNTAGVSTSGNLGAGVFYTYTKNADDTYNLTAAQNQGIYATDLGLDDTLNAGDTSYTVSRAKALFLTQVTAAAANWTTPTPTSVESILATSSTVFLYFNPSTLTYNVYTGIANAPSYSAGGTVYVLEDSTGAYAQVVVCIGGTSTATAATVDTIFVSSGPTTTLDALYKPVYTYTVVKNGVAGETVSSYVSLTAGDVYFVNDYSTDGIINSTTSYSLSTLHTSVDDITYSAGTFFVNAASDAAYILSSDAKIFMYNEDTYATTQISAEAAAAFNYSTGTHELTVVEVSTTNDAIAAVYITVNPA